MLLVLVVPALEVEALLVSAAAGVASTASGLSLLNPLIVNVIVTLSFGVKIDFRILHSDMYLRNQTDKV